MDPVSDPAGWVSAHLDEVATAFFLGAGFGWTFAQRTVLKTAQGRIDELKATVKALQGRVDLLEDQRFELAREGAGLALRGGSGGGG